MHILAVAQGLHEGTLEKIRADAVIVVAAETLLISVARGTPLLQPLQATRFIPIEIGCYAMLGTRFSVVADARGFISPGAVFVTDALPVGIEAFVFVQGRASPEYHGDRRHPRHHDTKLHDFAEWCRHNDIPSIGSDLTSAHLESAPINHRAQLLYNATLGMTTGS